MNKLIRILKERLRIFDKKPRGLILKAIYELSDNVIKYGADLQMASHQKYFLTKSKWMQLTRSVLEKQHESAITYHRAIVCLSENGWAHNSNPLIRTLIELIVNCGVIIESDCEFRSFRYFVFELLKLETDSSKLGTIKNQLREELFVYLNEDDKKKADGYLNRSDPGFYWYSGIYNGPRDFIRKKAPLLLDIYDMGGSASHGGQLGYKILDVDPKSSDINPRKDPYSANLTIAISTRYLLELSLLRDQFEHLDLSSNYEKYFKEHQKLRAVIEKTKEHRIFLNNNHS